jgi:hypothetical protein
MPDADTTTHTRRRRERRVVAQRGRSAPDDERSAPAVIVIGAIRGVFAPTRQDSTTVSRLLVGRFYPFLKIRVTMTMTVWTASGDDVFEIQHF